MNRRNFLKTTGCGAMGMTTFVDTLKNLTALNGAISGGERGSNFNDYRALVCILLAGGIDSYNMLVPTGTDTSSGGDNGYNHYTSVRSDLSLTSSNILSINTPPRVGVRGRNSVYGAYGMHNQLAEMRTLFNANKMAFMTNIGTLVEPIQTSSEYYSGLKKVPLGLYSHSDQIMQWQTSVPQSRDAVGFGGRVADLLNASNASPDISMNISLAGKNLFQRGYDLAEYSISNNINASNVGFQSLPSWWGNSGLLTQLRDAAVDSMATQTYASLLQKTFANNTKNAINSFATFKEALLRVPSFNTTFPNTGLSNDLSAVAKVMSVRNFLGVKRQIFFITYGGWDMHDGLLPGLNQRLPVVSQALNAFYNATQELGIADKVATFTISDFGRTITSNGQGSDHAWGGNMMVLGDSVQGGKLYGGYPLMNVGTNMSQNPHNISFRGNFIPAVSTDEFYAELALWYGVSPNDLCYVLPNLRNFYTYSPGNYPVGFMNFNNTTISNIDHPKGCLNA
jgi:uncharacterized protein (DUF1501 family)